MIIRLLRSLLCASKVEKKNASLNLVIEMSISTYDEQHSAHQLPSPARGEKCFKRSFFSLLHPGSQMKNSFHQSQPKFVVIVTLHACLPLASSSRRRPCRDALLRMTGFVNGARKKASPNSTAAAQVKMMCAPINYETSHKRN